MAEPPVVMPDGTHFEFWDDRTEYARLYHVAQGHPDASDDNPGTEEKPWRTISRAADVLQPGEKVVVHEGIYRECVRAARGGEGPDRMIAYEAAPGEEVHVRGSEVWAPAWRPGEGWKFAGKRGSPPTDPPPGVRIWTGDLPAEWFIAYNPFAVMNFSPEYTTFVDDWTEEETNRFLLRRGMVFADGRPLREVRFPRELSSGEGVFWVEDPGLRIHLRLWGDADPADFEFEVTAREQVLAGRERGLAYVRVSGLHFSHAADGVPVPQRAMVSAWRGHHWIVEDCSLRWANACGLDVGNESWHSGWPEVTPGEGRHVIRRNYVADCGICGLAAVHNNRGSLVEDNLVERIGGMGVERLWETAGLKFHRADGVLIRRNVFRHITDAPGIWLDYLNRNTRVTENVVADVSGILGGIYVEVSRDPNLIDHNVIWDVRRPGHRFERAQSGCGVHADTGEKCTFAHNLFGRISGTFAVMLSLLQSERRVRGRTGLCRGHRVLNNLFTACPERVLLSRLEDNVSDGNLFDERDDWTSLCLEYPAPRALVTLDAWQEHFGLDRGSRQARIDAEFDPETLDLTVAVEGELPACVAVPPLSEDGANLAPGPFPLKAGRQTFRLEAGGPWVGQGRRSLT